MIKINTFKNLDCLVGLAEVENESIDLLLTDPPYNVSMKSNFNNMGRKGIDFGEWDKEFNQEEWLLAATSKVKKGGSAVIFNAYKNIGVMTDILTNNGFTVKEMIIWKKPNPMPRNRDRLYVTSIEIAIWAVKGKGWTFNRSRENYENAIFEYPSVNHKKRIHPTQKPEQLIKDIMSIHSNEKDVILDCFAGSGTILKVAKELNRNYIGFELSEEYYNKAVLNIGGN